MNIKFPASNPTMSPAVTFDASGVPEPLRSVPNWLLWRYESRDGRPTKVPYSARTGLVCDATSPSSWSDFGSALSAYTESAGRYSGLGFGLGPDAGITAIDIDGCFDQDGTLAAEARRLVEQFQSYTERTPGGQGLRILALGSKSGCPGSRSKALEGIKEIEVYDARRYITVTGVELT
jgi:putative DNA primase/helicase